MTKLLTIFQCFLCIDRLCICVDGFEALEGICYSKTRSESRRSI